MFADLKEFSGYDLEKILKSHSFSKGQGLNDGIHLLTFKKLTSDTALVRFAHLFEENEDPSYGRVLEEDAGAFLQKLGCKGPAVEVTASGNQNLSTAVTKRRLFTDEILAYGKRSALANDTYELDNWKITLNPMEVRTFRVKCA